LVRVRLFSFLLLTAICLPFLSVSKVSSQTSGTVTGTTIQTPPAGQCSVIALPFSAPVGTVLSGEFTADVPITFYIFSKTDFNAFTQAANCALPESANPLFLEPNVIGYGNPYSSSPIPTNGTYVYVFVYRNNGLTHLSSGYATVNLTYPSSVTFLTGASTITMTFSEVTSNTTPEFPDWSTWPVLILLTGLVGTIIRSRKHDT